ncbi:hypothetical protein D5018_20855 [Parashewanella curva]|uniref:Uncharacterized protein n=1 Tax=Parashewanella curva TaxID=2338552 RepID=A0A3L8PQY3_9GAMM|nr:hypothetical protein D5018_20855 [Parashewanella curva]
MTKKNYVSLAPYRQLNLVGGNTSYVLFVNNLDSKPFNVSRENVKVTFIEAPTAKTGSKSVPIRVNSYDEIIAEIREDEYKQRYRAFLNKIEADMNIKDQATTVADSDKSGSISGNFSAMSTGRYSNGDTVSINTDGSLYGGYGGSTHTTIYNPALAQVIAAKNQARFANNLNSIAQNAKSQQELLNALFLKSISLPKGKSYGGLVVTDTRGLDKELKGTFLIQINLDGQEYDFKVGREYYNVDATAVKS